MENDYLAMETLDDGVVRVELRGPGKVTTLSSGMVAALERMMDELEQAKPSAVVLIGGKPAGFMAGADLEEFLGAGDGQDPDVARHALVEAVGRAQRVFDRLEALDAPSVAAIHGAALGGGYELALACRARVAADDPRTSVGLPEVRLGLVPAAGGTQRLTRLVGMTASMELILAGKRLDAGRALKKGLVDRVVPPEALESQAVRLAVDLAAGETKVRRRKPRGLTTRVLEAVGWGRDTIESQALKRVKRETRGHYPAPVEAAKLISFAADGGDLQEGLRREREAIGELLSGPVARSLIQVFFLDQKARNRSAPEGTTPREVRRIGVLGAGFMGAGVAQLAAAKGYRVLLKDRGEEALGRGMSRCAALFKKLEKIGRLGPGGVRTAMGRILPVFEYADLHRVDLAVEAVFEDPALKREVLAAAEAELPEHAVLATNTSGIPLAELTPALARPENLVGMHFFSPVHKMPLLEVIRGEQTSPEALATVCAVGRKMGKAVVVVKDGPGFFTTRVLGIYLAQVMELLLAGAKVDEIDEAFEGFGWPVGPCRLLDEVGIDVGAKVSKGLRDAFPDRVPDPAPLLALVKSGRTGRKAGKGFYRYGPKAQGREVDESIYVALPGRRDGSPGDPAAMVSRVMAVLVNECARCLEEGVVESPADADTALIMGLGFPPFRGGLFRWVDSEGAGSFVSRLRELAEEHGDGFAPCARLVEVADAAGTFYQ